MDERSEPTREILEKLKAERITSLEELASRATEELSREGKFDPKVGAVLVGDWYVLVS